MCTCFNASRFHILSGDPNATASMAMLYFDTPNVEISQQRPLYDCTSFTAAVGGALGLFLGFSFLDFFYRAIAWGAKKMERHAQRIY